MELRSGDRVQVESESTERPPRTGVIEEVLRGAHSPRYRISWDDYPTQDRAGRMTSSSRTPIDCATSTSQSACTSAGDRYCHYDVGSA
jgi:hypothetical protein